MATKKENDARLAKEAFNSVFEGARVEGRVPDLKLPQKTPPSSPPPDTQSARKTGLYLLLPHGGFTHPENGHFLMMPKEFKAILSLEKKAVAQVVYEIIDQTIGWEDPEGVTQAGVYQVNEVAVFFGVGAVKIIKTHGKILEVLFVFLSHLAYQFFRGHTFLFGTEHDGCAVGIVGTDVITFMTA